MPWPRETEPDWDVEIAGDTKEECAKFGPVAHLHVDRTSKVCHHFVVSGDVGCNQCDIMADVLSGSKFLCRRCVSGGNMCVWVMGREMGKVGLSSASPSALRGK